MLWTFLKFFSHILLTALGYLDHTIDFKRIPYFQFLQCVLEMAILECFSLNIVNKKHCEEILRVNRMMMKLLWLGLRNAIPSLWQWGLGEWNPNVTTALLSSIAWQPEALMSTNPRKQGLPGGELRLFMMWLREGWARQNTIMPYSRNLPTIICSQVEPAHGNWNSALCHFAMISVSFQRPLTHQTSCVYLTFYDATTCCPCTDSFCFCKMSSEPRDNNSFPSDHHLLGRLSWSVICLNGIWNFLCLVYTHIHNLLRADYLE